jgi:hypothetical protein
VSYVSDSMSELGIRISGGGTGANVGLKKDEEKAKVVKKLMLMLPIMEETGWDRQKAIYLTSRDRPHASPMADVGTVPCFVTYET